MIAEESLAAEGAPDVADYKFFTFDGRPVLVQMESGRRSTVRMNFYAVPDWRPLRVSRPDYPTGEFVSAPAELELMLETASLLGQGWDFMRIDLYARDGKVWLGELTPYPNAGQTLFEPRAFDRDLGAHWTLPERRR